MELNDIFLRLIAEQNNDDVELPLPPEDGEERIEPDTDNDQETDQETEPEQITNEPQKPKKLSPIQSLKLKWKDENPGLTEQGMNEAIMFFNRRKNGLIEYKTPGTVNPITQRRHVNLPEVAALVNRFPEMHDVLSNHAKIRDIQNYTWEQLEFYIDRVNTVQTNVELDVKIEGDTPELQKAGAYRVWENARNKVVNENNLIAIRVESLPESLALGYLQHIINKEDNRRTNNNWCITWDPKKGNMYYNYRNRRAYYFIMDKSRNENDSYFLSVLQPIKAGKDASEYPYVITPRENISERRQLTWREVVNVWPALEGKESLFRYFDLVPKEIHDISVNNINFIESTRERPNPYDFARQDLATQIAYINSGRYINNTRCFDTLPFEQKKQYILKASIEGSDYKKRFRCDNPSDPLGIINLIQDSPGGLYKTLDEDVLKNRLKLVTGVYGLKIGIIGMEFKVLYTTMDGKYGLFQQRTNNLIGVMNTDTLEVIKPMRYTHITSQLVMDPEKMVPYLMYRFAEIHPGQDYFYFFMSQKSLTGDKSDRGYMRGLFYEKDKGDELFSTGRLRLMKKF